MKHYLNIQNKKYTYTIHSHTPTTSYVECPAANIAQEFLNEDIPPLLIDLPSLILAEKEHSSQQSASIRIRISPEDKKAYNKKHYKKDTPPFPPT